MLCVQLYIALQRLRANNTIATRYVLSHTTLACIRNSKHLARCISKYVQNNALAGLQIEECECASLLAADLRLCHFCTMAFSIMIANKVIRESLLAYAASLADMASKLPTCLFSLIWLNDFYLVYLVVLV